MVLRIIQSLHGSQCHQPTNQEVTPLEITIGIGTDEIKEIIMEHIKTKGFNVTEDDISFVIGKEETVTGNAKKIKHALIRCDIQIER